MKELWIILLAAHCYGDFLLQTNGIVKNKRRISFQLLHAGIHALLAYVLFQQWSLWQLPVLVLVVHGLIDWGKMKAGAKGRTPIGFAVDQAAHVVSLWAIALVMQELYWVSNQGFTGWGWNWIIGGAGFCAAVLGAGFFIGEVASKMMKQNDGLEQALSDGLKDGGKQIGQLERALIFALIAIGQPAGIGFLVAAKSILRFQEAKQQNLAEYVLIGTLWSFGLAITISWVTQKLIQCGGGMP